MPEILVNGVMLNYELDGAGDEVLLILNGIMMSVDSWTESIKDYTDHFKVLRVDFRDQGRSEKMHSEYSIEIHADDLNTLLDTLSIPKVHVMGISYGGEVAMLFALNYPQRVNKLVLANTTARVTRHLRAIGASWEEAAQLYNGEKFFKMAMPLIYSPNFYDTHYEWLESREKLLGQLLQKPWFDAFVRLSKSTKNYDILNIIENIDVKTLCIASDQDIVTPISELEMIHERIQNSDLVVIPNAGHASCYEKMTLYNAIVTEFLIT